jgi:DNA-binding transcriptional regulator YhcF (GntR family)
MLLQIKPESDTPIYLQLRDQIVAGVASGELRPGASLPSVREFARDLGVNYHTVNKAYALLRDEGYVNVYGRRGVYVAKPPAADEAYIEEIEAKLRKLIAEAKSKGMAPDEIVDLAAGLAARLSDSDESEMIDDTVGTGGEKSE